jgi:pimeloyl-ACP methyl ester carboxylesterase
VPVGRLRLSTLAMGEGPEDVLLLHGLGGTKSSFLDTAAALSRRYRVHALDLPGFGGSSKPPLVPYEAPFFARTVIGAMDAMGIARAHVVGNSMGGRVALELGLEHPDRVGGLARGAGRRAPAAGDRMILDPPMIRGRLGMGTRPPRARADRPRSHVVGPPGSRPIGSGERPRRRDAAGIGGFRMRVAEAIDVNAPPALVWDHVSDPGRYLHFMSGITRWSVEGEQATGLGARYRMLLLRVGSAEVGGPIELVEFKPARDLAWNSVTGVDQRGRWRIRERDGGGSRVELRLQYGVAGAGLSGWLVEVLAARTVQGHLRRSLRQLKRQVEHEQLRVHAAARREARRRVLAQRRHGERRGALAAADEAHALARRGLHVDGAAERGGERVADRLAVGGDLGALEHHRHVDVLDRPDEAGDVAQQLHRVGVLPDGVAVGEVLADVAQPGRAEQRVGDRVGEDVGVGVAGEAGLVRDLHAAEDEPAPGRERVRVDPDAGAGAHQPIGSSRRSRRSKTASSRTPSSPSSSSAWS